MAPKKKAATLQHVAEAAGVSQGAVSQILGNPEHPRFPEATRERVREAARRLRYRPNHAAQTLRSGRSRLIGMVTPWNVPELIETIERATSENGYRTMLQFTLGRDTKEEVEALHAAIDRGVDGIIWLPSNPADPNKEVLGRIRDSGVRVVFLERPPLECPFAHDAVKVDMAGPLFDRIDRFGADSHDEVIAAVHGIFHEIWGADAEAFKARMDAHDRPARIVTMAADKSAPENARRVLDELTPGKRALVICFQEGTAVRLTQEAEARGLRIPADFGLIGFGDVLVSGEFRSCEITRPPVTALRRPYGKMGAKAVEMLVRRIEAPAGEKPPAHVLTFPATWIERGSTFPTGEGTSTFARTSLKDS